MTNETTHKPMRRRLSGDDTAELREILALPHIAAMTPAQRVEHAQNKLAGATANYRGWATPPTNESVLLHARRCVETLENAVVLLQIAAGGDVEGLEVTAEPIPAETAAPIPDETPDEPSIPDWSDRMELGRARRYCFAVIAKAKLPGDTLMMRAAYSNYFNEYAGDSTTKWTAGQWQKMGDAVSAGVWKRAGKQWLRIPKYTGQISRGAA